MRIAINTIIIVLIWSSIFIKNANSQDIHFSQYDFSPLILNPANTGNFYGNWRFSNLFRSQWKKFADPGYQTFGVSFDKKFENLFKNLSLGGVLIYDKSGSIDLTVTKFLLSASYKKVVGRNIFRTGIQGGLVFKQFTNATYSTQFDVTTGSINPSLPSLETGMDNNIAYPDMNAGILWKRKIGRFEPEIGVSFFHINLPKERFTDLGGRLKIRSMYSLETRIIVGDYFSLVPNIYYQKTTKAENMLAGCRFRFDLKNNASKFHYILMGSSVRSGFGRQTDAAIVSLAIAKGDYLIGASFDINISELKAYTQSVGGFEIGLIYTGLSHDINKNSLPCSRE